MNIIEGFRGQYYFLSNFSDSKICYKGHTYKNGEAAFHSEKNGFSEYKEKLEKANPSEAKKLGRRIKLRPDWEQVKETVMHDIVYAKFSQNEDLKRKLLATGNKILIESNTWHDNYWGNCICAKCKNKYGKNMLGITLMRVREELKQC